MIYLPRSVQAWGTPAFHDTFKQELEQLDPARLPLQQGLSSSSYALDEKITVLVKRAAEQAGAIHATVGIFFSGVIAGCSCADDPTPVDTQNEYCEVVLVLDKATAEASIRLLD